MVGALGFEPRFFLLPKQVPLTRLGDAPNRDGCGRRTRTYDPTLIKRVL